MWRDWEELLPDAAYLTTCNAAWRSGAAEVTVWNEEGGENSNATKVNG